MNSKQFPCVALLEAKFKGDDVVGFGVYVHDNDNEKHALDTFKEKNPKGHKFLEETKTPPIHLKTQDEVQKVLVAVQLLTDCLLSSK